jgi:hypothetical protein
MLLMSLAHHANMYRVWANVVLTGQFTPIPRLYAAGAISFPNHGSAAPAVASVLDDLGELVVRVEQSATAGGMDAAIVRHQETRVVDDALRRIATVVRASGDPAATRA